MPGSPTLIAAINSGAIAVGFTGGTAILAAAAGGADFKVLVASHVRANHDLIVKPEIKRAEDLRGKRIGVTSIGGTGSASPGFPPSAHRRQRNLSSATRRRPLV